MLILRILKMKFFLIFFLAFGYSMQINAQKIPCYLKLDAKGHCENKHFIAVADFIRYSSDFEKQKQIQALLSQTEFRNYDVLSYDLYLDWYNVMKSKGNEPEDLHYTGVQKIKIRTREDGIKSIVLDGPGLIINKVFLDGAEIDGFTQPEKGLITISLMKNAAIGEEFEIEIQYEYVAAYKDIGFHLYPKGTFGDYTPPYKVWSEEKKDSITVRDTIFTPERLAYTMSEPTLARIWMPCNDQPNDKADVTISIKVPVGYNVVANGLLEKTEKTVDSVLYVWKSYSPMSTYLISVICSKFHRFSDWYRKTSNPKDSIEVQYYCWAEDFFNDGLTDKDYNAPRTYYDVVNMIKFMSEKFIEYPFEKYGMVTIQPFSYGGMEHQTITALNRLYLKNIDRYGRNIEFSSQNVIMHELAHQWIGDLVTCATWNDLWINEGGAVWCESLWQEHKYGEMYYEWSFLGRRDFYLYYDDGIELPPIYGLPIEDVFNTSLVYFKSSWVYHMLYAALGHDKFLNAMRGLMKEYGNKSLDTKNFSDYLKKSIPDSKIDFDTFFEQWIYKPGHPIFDMTVNTKQDNGLNIVKVRLNQVQDFGDVPKVFVNPVAIEFYGPNKIRHFDTLYVNKREQEFELNLPFMPDLAFIDTTFIFCEVRENTISGVKIAESDDINTLKIYPNPVIAGNNATLFFNIKNSDFVEIGIYDIFGRKELDVYSAYCESGAYDFKFNTSGMASGAYMIRIKTSKDVIIEKFCVIK